MASALLLPVRGWGGGVRGSGGLTPNTAGNRGMEDLLLQWVDNPKSSRGGGGVKL